MKNTKLFCIPYSGGSATSFLRWGKFFPDNIKLCPVELAGRGTRFCEPLYNKLCDAVYDVTATIIQQTERIGDYAIYGHSMGCLIAFETYYKLKEKGCRLPTHMFFSGREAPQTIEKKTDYYKLPDDKFLEVVCKYGNNTEDILKDKEMFDLFTKILRADFKITETYKHVIKKDKISCDITVINGSADQSVAEYDMNDWKFYAGKRCDIKSVAGDHFFLLENSESVCNIINSALAESDSVLLAH